jgi:hypothetical protein
MWDDNISTINDKERWIYECITTSSSTASEGKEENDGGNNGDVEMKTEDDNNNTSTTILDVFTSQQNWGLTQRHGGPCGVLAAIQAEMIRVLLWGVRLNNSSSNNNCRHFDYPYSPTTGCDNKLDQKPPTQSEVGEAMAMAIAMILARATVIPAASSEKRSESCTVRLVFPASDDDNIITHNTQPDATVGEGEETKVQRSPWIEEMLNSSTSNTAASKKSSSGLLMHSITASLLATTSTTNTNDDFNRPETKRPRKKEVSFSDDSYQNHHYIQPVALTPQQIKITNLANAVTNYLLGLTTNESEKTTPSKPLDFFRGPGGVMYFVMSLVESRGIERIKADMDDPNTTITSQFGHSSQELMNLLLTGHAVSNVFDNSMTLSEELTCRGIQYRPAIGYLSQLESLRYCEVGSYYKSPIFPVWIVASSTHFSVVFGDSRCLQESKSDLLLERCRRAFRKVEDGESGFIMKDMLGKVVEELDLITFLGANGVETLAAYLEVPGGGGIILWDDFWKACSRLMTGSSLQSIMRDKDDDEVKIIGTIKRQATPPPSTMSSDEELARKLAAEWAEDDDSIPGLEPANPYSFPAQAKKPIPLCPPDVDPDVFNSLPLEMQQEIAMERERTTTTHTTGAADTDTQLATADDAGTLSVDGLGNNTDGEGDSLLSDDKKPAAKEPEKMDSSTQTEDAKAPPLLLTNTPHNALNFEKHDGQTFPLYHYNGLRGGCLTPFRVTRLSAEEAVGASIALSSKGGGDSGGDLQDVIRTKWPSCMFNWLDNQAPYID